VLRKAIVVPLGRTGPGANPASEVKRKSAWNPVNEAVVYDSTSVTFPKNSDLPNTVALAVKARWIKISESCEEGIKYVSPEHDFTNIVIFDKSGKLAGIQVAIDIIPTEPMLSRYYFPHTFNGRQRHSLIGYFVDPSTLCVSRTTGPFGDRVWWKSKVHSGGYFKLPLTSEDAEKDKNWKLGECILGMGIHYWYNVSTNMPCNEFTPFFVMYNRGVLTTFAVGFGGKDSIDGPNKRFEHAPKWVVRRNFKPETLPECLMRDETKVSTMHFMFTSVLSNRCQETKEQKDAMIDMEHMEH
jgi:hypothetical protein